MKFLHNSIFYNQILYICEHENKMSMKKQLLSLILVLISFLSKAQYDYTPTGRNDVPVLGMQWGIVGGGFTSMMNNRDDIDADQRLDPQSTNFNYAAGIEFVYWFQKNIGFGAQALYWNGGAKYVGKDTVSQTSLTATTKLTYLKVPFLFHFKSYNSYYPDRRTRFSAIFGPYIAVMSKYEDDFILKNSVGDTIGETNLTGLSFTSGKTGAVKGKISSTIYNPIDIGFVAGFGAEVRVWRRTVVALNLRADIGISNVENTKTLRLTYDSDLTTDHEYKPWDGLYAKYVAPNGNDLKNGFEPNRPATKNFTLGAFLSIRKYLSN